MDEIALLKRRLEREIQARKNAESILEDKALELFKANQDLAQYTNQLEHEIALRLEELNKTQIEYKQLIEGIEDAIVITDLEGHLIYINPYTESKTGFTLAQVKSMHLSSFIRQDFKNKLFEQLEILLHKSNLKKYFEAPIYTIYEKAVWFGINAKVNLEKKEIVFVGRDITELKQAQKELLYTQNRLLTMLQSMNTGIVVCDEKNSVTIVNKMFSKIFGIEETEVSNLCNQPFTIISDFIASKMIDCNECRNNMQLALSAQVPYVGKVLHTIDGKVLILDFIPILNKNKFLGFILQFTDNTNSFYAEDTLRKSEDKYRGIIENMELGLLEVDNNGLVVKVYDHFVKLSGYSPEELIGRNAADVLIPNEYLATLQLQTEDRKKGIAGTYEIQIKTKSGDIKWVLISGAPIYNQTGETTGSIGIHYDISERKKLEQDLIKTMHIAEEAKKAESQFLANMSHEIRTPLNAIVGITHLLYDTQPTRQQAEYYDGLLASSNFLLGLISDILDMSKIEAGRIDIHEKSFNLVGLLKSLKQTYQLKFQNRPVEMLLHLDDDLVDFVIGDEILLNQILTNLISNADKFTLKGSILLEAHLLQKSDNQVSIQFSVKDTGIGMPQDKLDTIFLKFTQIKNEAVSKQQGTGLGLAITKKLVEIQGGNISVTSKLDEGSCFSFCLTYKIDKENNKIYNSFSKAQPKTNIKDLELLFAEDNAMNRRYLDGLMKKWEIKNYDLAIDGKQAIEMAANKKYDIIFLDMQMPIMDGNEAAIYIKNQILLNSQTPLVALTAAATSDQRKSAFAAGIDEYITKPFTPEQILNCLEKYSLANGNNLNLNGDALLYNQQLNVNMLTALYDTDYDQAAEMFSLFISEIYPELKTIFKQHTENFNLDAFTKEVHKLKPTFSLVGLTNLEELMQDLENKSRNLGQPTDLLNNLQNIIQLTEQKLIILQNQLQLFQNLNK